MDNCPHQTVLVGEPQAVERARELLVRDGLIHEQLPYDRAVHTPRFGPFADVLREVFAQTEIRPARTALYSCTTSERYPEDPASIRELLVEHWIAPVEFRRTIEARHAAGDRVFIECGARGNLSAFIEDVLRGKDCCAVPMDTQRRSGTTQLNHLVGQLLVHGVEVDATALHAGRATTVIDLDAPPASDAQDVLRIPLSSGWPMLRLGDEAVAAVRGAGPSRRRELEPVFLEPTAAPEAEIAAAANGDGDADGLPFADEGDDGFGEELLVGELVLDPEAALAWLSPLSGEDADRAIDAHLSTMEQFLSAHAEVMQAYLAPPSTPSPLGTIVARTKSELVALRTFDPAEDASLDDHRLGGALVVVPLTLSLALMAEAAAELVEDLPVVGLRDVRAHRWIAVDEEPPTVEITARRLSDDGPHVRVRVQARVVEPAPAAELPPEVEATVLLSAGPPPTPPAMAPPPLGEPSILEPERLYRDTMFHGPSWQAVRSIDATGPRGVRARLEVLEAPALALDPVVLDAAGQLVGFWTAEQLPRGRVVFPFRLAALDVFGPPRAVGESLTGVAQIELVGDLLTRADIDVLDADGRPWMRLSGWEDKRFDLSPALEPLVLGAEGATMSVPWPAPIAAELRDGRAVQCRRIPVPGAADADLWGRIWAQRVLGPDERREFADLRMPPARRVAWLAGRTAAKEALAELLLRHHGRQADLRDIRLSADARGRPVASGPALDGLPTGPAVSISHRGAHAVALVALDGMPGIDLEVAGPPPERFSDVAFAEGERALLAGLDETWPLRCFCAKEAAGKALGIGLPHGPRGMTVTAVDTDAQAVTVRASDADGPELSVRCTQEDDVIVATTLIEKGAPR